MKFFFLAALFLLIGTAWAGEPPQRTKLEDYLMSFTDSFDREKRYLFAEHFPKLFPIPFLCQLEETNGKPFTVVPGDWLDVNNGGVLRCPGTLEATIEKQSRLRVSKYGSAPLLHLEKGRIEVRPGTTPLFLEMSTIQLSAVGTGKAQRLSALSSDHTQVFGCNGGAINADLKLTPAQGLKQYLFSHSCRMELRMDGREEVFYMLSHDLLEAANIVLPRRVWPILHNTPAHQFLINPSIPLPMILELKPEPGSGGKIQVRWQLPLGILDQPTCVVYAQPEKGKPTKEAARFEARDKLQGELLIDPGFRSSIFSLVCEDKKSTYASMVTYQ